ncbi:hypothetical protein Tco_1439891 [Tanacetum coccineum]
MDLESAQNNALVAKLGPLLKQVEVMTHDAKTLFKAIETRFGGNEATKKTQKTLLKQMLIFWPSTKWVSRFFIEDQEANAIEDDLEENDLNWQLALLSFEGNKKNKRKFISDRTGRNASIAYRYDILGKRKQEVLGIQESQPKEFKKGWSNRSQDSSRRTVNVEESSSKAMLAIDGVGFDWSFMTEEEIPTNFALMAFSDSKIELNKYEFDLANYKRGLAYVEEQLVFYKKSEGMLCDQIVVLKRDALFNESEINALKIQIERLKKEKKSNLIKIDNFENASKSLDKLIGCQISDNNRKSMGYNAVAPPPTCLFAPPTIDLSNSGLEEFKQPEFGGYGVKVNKKVNENSSNEIKKTSSSPIIEDWVSDCDEDETLEKVSESANVQKPKQADQPRKISQNPRNNSTNWNTPMSKKLGDKKMVQKPVLNNVKNGTGQREVRPIWNNAMRTNHQNFSTYRSNFSPTAVLTNSGLVPISTARQSFSRAATSVSTAMLIKTAASKPFVNVVKSRPNDFQKSHSPSRRSFYQHTTLKNRNLNNRVNTVKVNSVNTAKGKRVISAVGEQGINVVKSKACWVWRPKIKVLDHVSKNNGSYICKQFDYVDLQVEIKGLEFKVLVVYHTTNGHQFTMSNRQERIGYSRANDNCLVVPLTKVGDEAVHKELGDRMERAATTASSFETEQDSVEETKAEALQVKYPIVDWEVHTEGSRKYWKIIRVGNITEAYQGFEDMLKGFDREDLDTLWSFVKGRFRPAEPSEDMEKSFMGET